LKKFLSFYFSLYIIFIFSFCFPTDVCAIEGEQRLYISKTGEMWNDYVNMMNIVFPGGKISGLYYHKLYAEYDPDVGGFVIIDKVPSHVSYTKEVGLASFGLCFSYNPEYKEGNEFGKNNFKVWDKLRVGDVLYPHGMDFTEKTIISTGKLSDGTLKTNAYFSVTFSERENEPTAFTGKKIVAVGDSVTCNGGWTEKVGDMIGCEIINSGVSANRATEVLLRFDEDVKAYSPDIVLITLGINDCVQYYYSEKTVYTFKNELLELYKKCNEIGARVVYITPNNIKTENLNYDRYKEYGGLSKCFPKFIEMIKTVSKETDSYFIDIYSFFDDTEKMLCDSVHPNKEGYDVFISVISEHLISYADRICGESLEGFASTGEGNFEIKGNDIYVNPCTVSEIKTYFCNEIEVFKSGKALSDSDYVTDGCIIYWLDRKGIRKDNLLVNIK